MRVSFAVITTFKFFLSSTFSSESNIYTGVPLCFLVNRLCLASFSSSEELYRHLIGLDLQEFLVLSSFEEECGDLERDQRDLLLSKLSFAL